MRLGNATVALFRIYGSCIWLRNATFAALSRVIIDAVLDTFGHGDMPGVEHKLLLRSHWSSRRSISSAVGPPINSGAKKKEKKRLAHLVIATRYAKLILASRLVANSKAVVRSHICMAPFEWPDRIKRRGRDPIRDDPSHSCTQNDVTVVPSTERITQIRSPFDANLT